MNFHKIEIGLCETCTFHIVIRSQRGKEFHLCEKSKSDAAFPKYPRLPVVKCEGFQSPKNAKER